MNYGLNPKEFSFQERLFVYNKALKKNCKDGEDYVIKDNYYEFFAEFFVENLLYDGEHIPQKIWDKLYKNEMDKIKQYYIKNQEALLKQLNYKLFYDVWDKYNNGVARGEMDTLGFFFHEHPLKHIKKEEHNIVSFNTLPETPEIERFWTIRGNDIPIYKLYRICGTVIAKDDLKCIVTILTADSGVVDVKFRKDYYAIYNKQLSAIQPDGTKKVIEKGWFKRGTDIIVQGFRQGEQFILKQYKNSLGHQLYKILNITTGGDITITNNRKEV